MDYLPGEKQLPLTLWLEARVKKQLQVDEKNMIFILLEHTEVMHVK